MRLYSIGYSLAAIWFSLLLSCGGGASIDEGLIDPVSVDASATPDMTSTDDVPANQDLFAEGEPSKDAGGQDGFIAVTELQVAPNPNIGLSVIVSFKTEVASVGSVVVESDGMESYVVESREGTPCLTHNIWVLGLHASRDYRFYGRATSGSEESISRQSAGYHTELLPDWFPKITVQSADAQAMQPGFTLFSLHTISFSNDGSGPSPSSDFEPVYIMLDSSGQIVWYSRWTRTKDVPLGFSLLDNGNVATIGQFGMEVHNLIGDEVNRLTPADLGLDHLHHDVHLLPNGNYVSLTTEPHPVPGSAQQNEVWVGDVVVEFQPDGTLVNQWPIDEFIPPSPEMIGAGNNYWDFAYPDFITHDVFHANSIEYVESDDSLIVGLRSLGLILRFRRDTGEVVWILGPGGTVQKPEVTQWFVSAHGASVLGNGNLVLYDNNFDNYVFGTSRAIEYSIENDGNDWLSHQVWEYQTHVFSPVMGYLQRLENGNTLVCNSFEMTSMEDRTLRPTIAEVTCGASPLTVFQLGIGPVDGDQSDTQFVVYRAYRINDLYSPGPD